MLRMELYHFYQSGLSANSRLLQAIRKGVSDRKKKSHVTSVLRKLAIKFWPKLTPKYFHYCKYKSHFRHDFPLLHGVKTTILCEVAIIVRTGLGKQESQELRQQAQEEGGKYLVRK